MRICVAMATYNGERYLREQLDSLAAQDRLPDELVVCDDCSTDGTLAILGEFAVRAPFPVRIYRNEHNLGFADNFLKAAKLCEGDWIAFCDQDDFWLPHKLARAEDAINQDRKISLVLQNTLLCHRNLEENGRIFPNKIKAGIYGPNLQFGFWVWLGCVQTFSAALMHKLDSMDRPPNYFPGHKLQSHDKWTCMIANAVGGIAVLEEPAVLYRRHDLAITGDYRRKTVSERLANSLTVGAEHYAFLHSVAQSSAKHLDRQLSQSSCVEWQQAFLAGSAHFRKLAAIMRLRADLYAHHSRPKRLATFVRLLWMGGYFGHPFIALGWRSVAKDLVVMLGGAGWAAGAP